MTRLNIVHILLAVLCLFAVSATHGRAPLRKRILIAAVPLVCFSCVRFNLGIAWLGIRPEGYALAITAAYILFWLVFTLSSRYSRFMTGCCMFFSAATLLAAVLGLAVRSFGWDALTILALLLAVFSTVPMYGLRLFLDWTGLELVSLSLSLLWLGYTLFLRRAKK